MCGITRKSGYEALGFGAGFEFKYGIISNDFYSEPLPMYNTACSA